MIEQRFIPISSALTPHPGTYAAETVPVLDRRAATKPAPTSTDCILVVDDNRANLSLMGALLEGAGHENVVLVEDPLRVVDLVTSLQPDAILLDLHMPRLSGFEILRLLEDVVDADDFLPVLVVTADLTTETRRTALDAGAHDILIKPVDVVEVVQRTNILLETRRLTRELRQSNLALSQRLFRQEEQERKAAAKHERTRRTIVEVLSGDAMRSVFQPIVDAAAGRIVGVEALTRFESEPIRSPDKWFADAAAVGLGFNLEMAAIRSALKHQDYLPEGAYLSVNCSPEVLIDHGLEALAHEVDASRVVLEMTEHTAISDYASVLERLAVLRSRGFRVAVDDAGSGFASLQHILQLRPDIIKLDSGLIRDIDVDPAKRALATAMITFAQDLGAELVAEGVETVEEFEAVRQLGISKIQGYLLGRPQAPPITISAIPGSP